MAYVKTVWVNGTAPALNDSNLNKIEQGIFDSLAQDGTTAMTGQLVTTAGSAATPAIAPTGDTNTGIFFPAADTIAFGEGGTEIMRITSAGNVGIGTAAPSDKLHVVGNIYLGTASQTIYTTGTGNLTLQTGTGNIIFARNNAADTTMFLNNSGNVGIGTASPTSKLQIANVTANTSCINAVANTTTGQSFGIALSAGSDSTDYALNIRNAAQTTQLFHITGAGNVGIGTTSPNDKLEVSGGIRRTLTVNGSNASPASQVGLQYQFDNSTSRSGIYFHNTYNNNGRAWMSFWITDASNVFKQAMVIDGFTENVGIGTNSPTSELHVYSAASSADIMVETNATGGDAKIALKTNGTGGRHWYWQTGDNASTLNGRLRLWDSTAGAERITITDAGNVGIGTASPTVAANVTTLCLNNTSGSQTELFVNGARTGIFTASPTAVSLRNLTTNPLLFFTDSVERFQVESGGRVRPSANNTYELGSSTFRWSTIYAQNALNTSDARLKTDVTESSLGLDFISALNPVQFRYIEGGNTVERVQTGTETVEISPAIPAQPEQLEVLDEEGNVIKEYKPAVEEVPAVTEEQPIYEEVVTPREGVRTHFGLIAQEVKAALPDGLDFGGWALADKDDADSTQFLGYMELIAPMIKAIKELNAKVEALEAQLAQQ